MSFRRWLERHGIWWHSQNLNEDAKGNPKGSKFWHGRAWLKWKEGACGLQGEWLFDRHNFCHAYVEVGGEDWIKIGVALPWVFAFWFHLDLKHRIQEVKEVGISLFQGLLSWRLWSHPYDWHEGISRWRSGSFDIPDFFLGRREFVREVLEDSPVLIKMPEKFYPGTCTLSQDTWKRSRWPWSLVLIRATIELDKPIPIPGKGENSWDLEDDGVSSMTMCAATKEEAVKILYDSVMETRRRRGWRR